MKREFKLNKCKSCHGTFIRLIKHLCRKCYNNKMVERAKKIKSIYCQLCGKQVRKFREIPFRRDYIKVCKKCLNE